MARGYEPRWDIDAAVGFAGEEYVKDIRDAFTRGSVEVKTDERAIETKRVYVEHSCCYDGVWKPSGIQTTQATVWAYVIGGVVLAAPTAVVRVVAEEHWRSMPAHQLECMRGSHPTKGVVIPILTYIYRVNYWRTHMDEVAA